MCIRDSYTGLDKIRLPENCTVLLECMSNLVANEMFQEEGAHENTVEAVSYTHLADMLFIIKIQNRLYSWDL